MTSTSRTGRPRTRSRSVHIPSHIPTASKAGKHRTTSAQKIPTKGKGIGKGKKATKRSNKAVAVVSSDSEDLEVDFPYYHPNQPHNIPTELPQQHNPAVDAPTEEQQELDHPTDDPIEEHPTNAPAEDIEQPQNPGNPKPLPVQPPMPMANNQLNWSHFRPEFSGTPNEDAEAHLLRMEDWMTTHNSRRSKGRKVLFNSYGRGQTMVCCLKCPATTIKLGWFVRKLQATILQIW